MRPEAAAPSALRRSEPSRPPLHGPPDITGRCRGDGRAAGRSERAVAATLRAGDVPVTLAGRVGETVKDDHNTQKLQGDDGTVGLRDWAIAERRRPDGTFEAASDALPNEKARPVALRRQFVGVARMARGGTQPLVTFAEALDAPEIVGGLLAG